MKLRLPQSFLIALQFLTVVPVAIRGQPDPDTTARSLLFYPAVGLLIGLTLVFVIWGCGDTPGQLTAALVLVVWSFTTGALHLDGLADSADAWVGGVGDRVKTLAIMKDPCCGPMGVVALALVLLCKYTALEQLIANGSWTTIALIPVLGRTAPLLLFLTTPYVRPTGLGSVLTKHLRRPACLLVAVVCLASVTVLMGEVAVWVLMTAVGIFLVLRMLMLRRIGGATGDTTGALIELIEAGALVTAVLAA